MSLANTWVSQKREVEEKQPRLYLTDQADSNKVTQKLVCDVDDTGLARFAGPCKLSSEDALKLASWLKSTFG